MVTRGNIIRKNGIKLKNFLSNVKIELKKVLWPNSKQLAVYTGVVFVAVAIVSLLIWIIDNLFAKLIRLFL